MTGKKNGVAAKLRSDNKPLINVHCIAHQLALACGDANNSVSYILTMEKILIQLWSLFKNSPKKADACYQQKEEIISQFHGGEIELAWQIWV
jgi:ubiquitin-protein ligase